MNVKELTGDMQLSRTELEETQVVFIFIQKIICFSRQHVE